jgi:membrane-bound ClpP family serine protease
MNVCISTLFDTLWSNLATNELVWDILLVKNQILISTRELLLVPNLALLMMCWMTMSLKFDLKLSYLLVLAAICLIVLFFQEWDMRTESISDLIILFGSILFLVNMLSNNSFSCVSIIQYFVFMVQLCFNFLYKNYCWCFL